MRHIVSRSHVCTVRTCLVLLALSSSIVLSSDGSSGTERDPVLIAQELLASFHGGDLERFVLHVVDPAFTVPACREFRQRVDRTLGVELATVHERLSCAENEPGVYKYVRYSRYSAHDRLVKTTLGFSDQYQIGEFSIETLDPEYPSPYADRATQTALRLPFRGTWYVVWGGRTMDVNNHAGSRDQRFAYDFTVRRGCSFRSGDGTRNEDYFSYGKAVLAPGNGIVVSVVNDVPENEVGTAGPGAGNRVVIDHGNGEFSFLCHLIPGSIPVGVGDHVAQGDVIGKCGNSGHSTAPGLHYHLQNTGTLFQGDGLPAQFQHYEVEGTHVDRGEPQGGEVVANR